jgi:hypothetical protein
MITREQLKIEVDSVDDSNIEVLHKIILALSKNDDQLIAHPQQSRLINPLKGSVVFESDLISPIDEVWEAEQ